MTTDTLDLLHQLTRTHKTTIENDDGTRQYVEVHSYLAQLQDAITGKSRGRGGNQTSAPLSTNALDLWHEIAETTLQHWPGYGAHTSPEPHYTGASSNGHPSH